MAFFKFRWPGHKAQGDNSKPAKRSRNAQAESIDAMRRRARHRLIGAAVLVLIGIVGFPILFDTQPRPVAVDIPIDIPDRNKVAPLVVPAAPAAPIASAPAHRDSDRGTVAETPAAGAAAGLDAGEEVITAKPAARASTPVPPFAPAPKVEQRAEPKPEARHESKPESKPDSKTETKPATPEPKPAARSDDSARARALLEGRDTAPATAAAPARQEEGRLIVQVGAFADADKARETRQKLERAGLKTYMQVVDTKDGKRTRVRVGPYANRSDADKAATQIKGLGLPASVLAL